jgi:hypothetical protein
MQDLIQLIDIVPTLEERASSKEFGKNTSDRPYID